MRALSTQCEPCKHVSLDFICLIPALHTAALCKVRASYVPLLLGFPPQLSRELVLPRAEHAGCALGALAARHLHHRLIAAGAGVISAGAACALRGTMPKHTIAEWPASHPRQ